MRVPIQKVPIDVRRRAARAVAAMTIEHLFPRDDRKRPQPSFGAEATPVFRPDLDDVAYWEIELEGLSTALPLEEGEAKEFDRGFILIGTGGHDVPVPHFSLDTAPPSRQLEALDPALTRVVKLDALAYASEDDNGTMLAHIGTMPPKLEGVPAELPKPLPAGWATTGSPTTEFPEDGDKTEPVKLRRSREERPFKDYGSWRSWEECKKGYAESYRLHLAALAQRASGPWQIEGLTEEFGQGIRSGETFTVLLLEEGKFELGGPGAEFVSAEFDAGANPPRLMLTPKVDASVRDTSFEVGLYYGSGDKESLPFFIVPEDAATTVQPSTSTLGPVFGGEKR